MPSTRCVCRAWQGQCRWSLPLQPCEGVRCVPAPHFHFYGTKRTAWPLAISYSGCEQRDAAEKLLDEPFGRTGRIYGGAMFVTQKCHAFFFFPLCFFFLLLNRSWRLGKAVL